MQRLLKIESTLNIKLVTGEFEIILWLYANGPTRSTCIAKKTKLSIANFQIILRKMRENGILNLLPNEHDRRGRVYDSAPHVRQTFDQMFDNDLQSRAILCAIQLQNFANPVDAPSGLPKARSAAKELVNSLQG